MTTSEDESSFSSLDTSGEELQPAMQTHARKAIPATTLIVFFTFFKLKHPLTYFTIKTGQKLTRIILHHIRYL